MCKYSLVALRAYKNLKRANQFMTLEAMTSSKNMKSIKEASNKLLSIRQEVLKNGNLKIKHTKQRIHTKGKYYKPDRSILEHSDPQRLINEFAGTGIKEGIEFPGMPGYKEIVNFGELIGYNISENSGEITATTWGKIHYAKDGVHIVPTFPRY